MWDKERLLLRRESGSGMYSVGSWFAAKTLTVAPVQVAQVTVGELWLAGYPGSMFGSIFDAVVPHPGHCRCVRCGKVLRLKGSWGQGACCT